MQKRTANESTLTTAAPVYKQGGRNKVERMLYAAVGQFRKRSLRLLHVQLLYTKRCYYVIIVI